MRLCLLDDALDFPNVSTALDEPNGLLAVGGDLSVPRLLSAYSRGVFPWYNEGEPILWWSPTPRNILIPTEFHLSKSSRKQLRKSGWSFSINTCFSEVIHACASLREEGTWISPDMMAAYCELHAQGHAHAIEIWSDDELVGGLYGVKIGRVFFGESMFSCESNGSKAALLVLSQHCINEGVALIDCQVESEHLTTLGTRLMDRSAFTERIKELACHDQARAWYAEPTPLATQL